MVYKLPVLKWSVRYHISKNRMYEVLSLLHFHTANLHFRLFRQCRTALPLFTFCVLRIGTLDNVDKKNQSQRGSIAVLS